jgi:hypothetical protein
MSTQAAGKVLELEAVLGSRLVVEEILLLPMAQ